MCKILKSIIQVDGKKYKNDSYNNKKIKFKKFNMNLSITNQCAFTKSGTRIMIIFVLLLSTATLTNALQQQQQQEEEEHLLSAEDNVRRSVVDISKTNYAAMADSILSIDADTVDHDDEDGEGGGADEEPATSMRKHFGAEGGDLNNSSDMDFDDTVATPLNVGVIGGSSRMRGGSVTGNALTNKPINGNL